MADAIDERRLSRRALLQGLGGGLGSVALYSLLGRDAFGATSVATEGANAAAKTAASRSGILVPHFVPRAKRVIYMHMVGGTSHIDLLDPKPELKKRDGEMCPDELFVGKQLAFIRERPRLLGSQYEFTHAGQSGLEVSQLLPELKTIADDITVVRSMKTDQFNHGPAQLMLLTGFGRFGRPSTGAWLSWGLGSENEDLPSFIVLVTGNYLGAGSAGWGAGFLPSVHQGVELRSRGEPVLFLRDPPGIERADRRRVIDTVNDLNRMHYERVGDREIETRIEQYEMAYRMQTSVPEVMDIWSEPERVHEAYGTTRGEASFANNCLLARRLVESGVRFVQLFDADWDHHGSVFSKLPQKCKDVDRPAAALVKDLKERGLLDDTLVIWTTEFGRTPMAQGKDGDGRMTAPGRDHHKDAFTIWMAGAGMKPGLVYGETDEFGYEVVANPVHVHDFNATLLHLLGIDHERFTYRYQGRDFRLTDVHGEVVHGLLA